MATVEVTLTENEILDACRYWATHRILNEGEATSANLHITVCEGKPTGTLNSCTVTVETSRMQKSS